eukprot:721893-Lingulodinium_polyedra.AAC.1
MQWVFHCSDRTAIEAGASIGKRGRSDMVRAGRLHAPSAMASRAILVHLTPPSRTPRAAAASQTP